MHRYQTQLQSLAVDAAFLARFFDKKDSRMPGVPHGLGEFSLSAKVRECLRAMVLDKDGSVLIEATGDRDKLELFCELLRAGNRFVDVRELRIREQDETVVYDDFTIR